jgi:hypothetical protein
VPVLVERSQPATRDTRVFIRGNRITRDERFNPAFPTSFNPLPTPANSPASTWRAGWSAIRTRSPPACWRTGCGRRCSATASWKPWRTSAPPAPPTHPELLDHLALRLRGDLQWSIKRFLREIALSSTYAQNAKSPPPSRNATPSITSTPAARARGSPRRWCATRPSRCPAALAQSLRPAGLPAAARRRLEHRLQRRPLEHLAGREPLPPRRLHLPEAHQRLPGFLTFDAPTRDACTARRIPSNTPLQALTVLNDPAFIEMAQSLANRMEGRRRARAQIRMPAACSPSTAPAGHDRQPAEALPRRLGGFPRRPRLRDKLAPSAERAALVLVANTLLNLDIALTR